MDDQFAVIAALSELRSHGDAVAPLVDLLLEHDDVAQPAACWTLLESILEVQGIAIDPVLLTLFDKPTLDIVRHGLWGTRS